MGQVIKQMFQLTGGILHTIWIGFCHVALLLLILALLGSMLYGAFWLLTILMWGSLILLGRAGSMIIWGIVLLVCISYGIGKEFKGIK